MVREEPQMLRITAEHKHCKCLRHLEGESIAKIFKDNDMSYDFWIVIDIEQI